MPIKKDINLDSLPPECFFITDKVPGMIAIYNRYTGKYLYVNKAVKQILGYTAEEVLQGGLPFVSSLIHPDDAPIIYAKNVKALEQANSQKAINVSEESIVNFEYRLKHKNGTWKWLHTDGSVLSRDKNNKVEYIMNISIDITERKEAEQQATEDLKRVQYALDQSAIIAITDRNGCIQYVNNKFEEISEYSREELIGKTHRIINSQYHPKTFFEHMWNTILSGKVWRGEIRNKSKNGRLYWVDTTITPLLNEKGEIEQFIAIRHDITKRKELERQKDEFIGIASHELKTPVTSLKGYVQVMHKRFHKLEDEVSAKYMAKMDAQINKLTGLIQDLLDVTKIETGKLQLHQEVFDMNGLVSELAEAMQLTTERHTIEIHGKVKKKVYADRERMGQVIINFLSNAIKYSPHTHVITIHVSEKNNQCIVCVQDFGVGIAKEKQSKVFERFYRVSGAKEDTFPGLGLGLFISSELVKRHHGTIWVESAKGKGSTFCFSLPIHGKKITSEKNTLVMEEMKHE